MCQYVDVISLIIIMFVISCTSCIISRNILHFVSFSVFVSVVCVSVITPDWPEFPKNTLKGNFGGCWSRVPMYKPDLLDFNNC